MFFFDPENNQEMSKEVWEQHVREEISKRADRLKEAVRLGGGAVVVARKIGMPIPTLNNYLAGRDMKASAMVLLAEGAGVSLDWLATGKGTPQGASSEPRQLDAEVLPPDLLDAPANFYILDTCIRSCQYFYLKLGSAPSLRDALRWIGHPYRQGRTLPDRPIDEAQGDLHK